MFWLFLINDVALCKAPWPPKISSHPWSIDFVSFVAKIIDIFVSGWAEVGAKNHIFVKKNLILLVFLGKNSGSHKINAKAKPKRIAIIVVSLRLKGIINVCGVNDKNKDWNNDPAKIAVRAKIVVGQLI